jgi:Lon protease-like protein
MATQKILYENAKYDISKMQQNISHTIPTLINTVYIKNSVVMPKCKSLITPIELDIPSVVNAAKTTGYVAIVREEYRHEALKKGCIARITELAFDDINDDYRLSVHGIKRFLSYQEVTVDQFPYEIIKPDFRSFKNDDKETGAIVDMQTLDSIFMQFFFLFLSDLNIDANIDFNSLLLDKFINSLITILPISDAERFLLSEMPSLKKRQDTLSLILNCQINDLTTPTKYH